jgi:ABC-type antimicrobial peptide transport system permease subunit
MVKRLKNKSSVYAVWIRKCLVIFQFSVSFVLICVTIIVFQQIRYGQFRPLGYVKENLLRISNINSIDRQFPIKEQIEKIPLVKKTAFANDPLVNSGNSGSGYQWKDKKTELNPTINRSYVTPGYIETIGLKMLDGRDFYEGNETDNRSVIINKTLADLMGEEGKINGELWVGNRTNTIIYKIVGIFDDYISDDIYRKKNDPMILYKEMLSGKLPYCFYIRFDSNAEKEHCIKLVKNTLSQFEIDQLIEYDFVDDLVNGLFENQNKYFFLVELFSSIAILISCLGLLGLVSFVAKTKTKEIGIRKIHGATVIKIVWMLIYEFLILVIISTLLAFPFAYYLIYNILQEFEYCISISPGVFFISMIITVVLSFVTLGFKAWNAALMNPIVSLKVE